MLEDSRFQKFVINRKLSLLRLLERAGYTASVQGTCHCMFHEDRNHRSAKVYIDDDGERLYCFAEHRMYGPADVLVTLLKQDLAKVFDRIWVRLSIEEKEDLQQAYGVPRSFLPASWGEKKPEIAKKFRSGAISYPELVREVVKVFSES